MTYAPRILNETGDYDGVRTAAGLNTRQLSDTAILSASLLPAVESKAIIAIPGYASLSSDYKNLLRSAVTKIVAARAILSLPESEKSLDYDVTRKRDEQVKILLDEAAIEIADIPGSGDDVDLPDILRVSGPTRTKKLTTGTYGWIYESSVLQ